ncbi:MAG: transglycosylase SLT domain-containing protein [Acidobacteriaceae bacterium]|nr:transglycosylase SLT domain-containing protein [Acidobacteriaceae bacterium]MBV9779505.1 transglycosylase SLT domain-containing protein [Acidobacteriaceae bacterium]
MLIAASSVAFAPPRSPKKTARPAIHTPKVVGIAGLIAVAQHQLDLGNLPAAAQSAESASSKAPMLDDYAQYIRAQAEYGLKDYVEVDKAATRVFNQVLLSPFVGPAAAIAVRAELDSGSPKQALELVKKYYDRIPQPAADLLLARSFEAVNDLAQAVEYYERVYYNYPSAREVTDAANALVTLKQRMGDAYPPPLPAAMIARAQKLFDAKNPAAARIELAAAIPQIGGAQRDLARVRLGEADFLSNNTAAAFQYLTALKVDDPEADAERINYLVRCVRKLDRHGDVKPFLKQLEEQHANSPWRLDTLILVADQARVDNDASTYLPLYRTCADTFSYDSKAAWCHWRIAFESYRRDQDTYDSLRSYIEDYPDSNDVNNALYFLGRLQERKNDAGAARACYEELIKRFPNSYYAIEARDRLSQSGLKAATPDSATVEFLESVDWPPRQEFPSFLPGETAQARLDRSQLLRLTGLNDFAEGELKFGARNDGEQENVYAYELAKLAAERNDPDQALRYIKAFAPGYLYMPLDEAPIPFWKLAFPIPYRVSIEQHSREQGLDPFLVAALIRQESEFNPNVISHANAYGLMQVLPSTGRGLSRHFRGRRYNAAQLLNPDRNVQLGTYYFRNLLNSFDGQPELALASYNAGPGRAALWRSWGPFREQAEFIETVPFHETRGYIQIVLRNADVYRRLYAGSVPDVPVYRPKPPPKKSSAKRKNASAHKAR